MDNAPSHILPNNLTNVQCEFLPPTPTSHLQPMDAGIINAYKAHYRRYVVRSVVDAIDAGRKPDIQISDAIRWTKLSWDQVTPETIHNCWRHTGILPAETTTTSTSASVNTNTGAVDADVGNTARPPQVRDFGNLFERLAQALDIELLMTPEEYVSVDNQLATDELMSDEC